MNGQYGDDVIYDFFKTLSEMRGFLFLISERFFLQWAEKMLTSLFDYHLPAEKIAQHPLEPRDSSKLLRVLNNEQ